MRGSVKLNGEVAIILQRYKDRFNKRPLENVRDL